MLTDSHTVELTRNFYEWELRGRGWARYPQRVALEPPFVPFHPHGTDGTLPHDDARRPTWLSGVVDRLFRTPPDPSALEVTTLEKPAEQISPAPDEREVREFLIATPAETRVPRGSGPGWLGALSTVSHPVAFELLGGGRRVEVRLCIAESNARHVLRQLQASLPQAETLEAPQTLREHRYLVPDSAFMAVEFGLAREFMVPLAPSARPSEEPLLPLIAALADLAEDELGLFQVLVEQVRHPWDRNILDAVTTPSGKPFFADAPEVTAQAREKVGSPLFATALRVASWSPDPDRLEEIVSNLASGLSHFGSPRTNELMPLPSGDLELLEGDVLDRSTHRSGMLLSADELSAFVEPPGSGVQVPELWRATERSKVAPEEVRAVEGCLLGTNLHRGRSTEVRLSVNARTKHVHVLGSSGTGKSSLLVQMILEDIEAGHGVGVLDPHGDLVNEVASRLPDGRLSDVVFFDPSDDKGAIGWNILGAHSELEKDLLASDLVGVFRRLSTSWGDQMTAVLANAVLVFLESPRGGTLEDLRRFLVDERFRNEILGTIEESYSASFWRTEFPLLIGRKPQAPILTRLDTFLRSKLIRRVVTARNPKLDFKQVTDGGLIFLGKLSAGAIGEENAALLGSLLVSKFHQVTLAREAQVASRRRPFFLYIDEFHHVATPSMASLFSGMRKYQLGLTVAHQNLYQLHQSAPEVERSLMANAYTRICFRLGEEDARQLARGFDYFEAEDFMRLGVGEAICRVGTRGADLNLRTSPLDDLDPEVVRERLGLVRELSARRWGVIERRDEAPRSDSATPSRSSDQPRSVETPMTASPRTARLPKAEPLPESSKNDHLDKLGLDYLELCAADPFLSVRERNERLGLSAWKGDRVKDEILARGFAREVAVNPGGRGERFKLLELTEPGRALLGSFRIPAPSGHGRGGLVHQWWARRIADWLAAQDVEAAIEDESSGDRVDVSFSCRGRSIAVEVEISDGHILENVRKDLAAGYGLVVCLVENSSTLERIRPTLETTLGDQKKALRLGALYDFEEILAPLISTHPPPLRAPNQNEEPRRRSPRTRRTITPANRELANLDYLSRPGALTTPAAADYLGLSPATLETMRTRGGGPVFAKLGARVVYEKEDLDVWVKTRKRRSTSDLET